MADDKKGGWDDAGSGAWEGAKTGAAIGSFVPGVGTALGAGAGALVGGIGGFFGKWGGGNEGPGGLPTGVGAYDPNADAFYGESGAMLADAQAGAAADSSWQQRQGAGMRAHQGYRGQQAQMRGQQLDYISQLQAMAAGTGGPSAAEQVVQSQRDKNIAQASALAASGQGISPALAMKQAQDQAGASGQAAAQQAATIRSQEAMQAQQMLGGAISGVRGQDIGWAMDNAGLRQQGAMANLDAQMQQRQMNDQMTQQFMQMGLSLEEARMQAGMELEKLKADQQTSMNEMIAGKASADKDRKYGLLGAGLGAVGAVAGAYLKSDETIKQDIKQEPVKLDKFMDELGSYSYKYKDEVEDVSKDTRFGIMAQELERSEVGSTFVKETSQGKAIDIVQSVGPILASLSRLNDRQKKMEKIMKKGKK